ncbi:carboxylesterase/lipase family protein [Streptomyces ardesiacus]|uniref:carboxylesterase/lipase family protein n=1 Tax=Streptomyces ardesiacus TaxID=285564 RepID=UPI0006E24A10|nr:MULTISPECIES: carboxylesterase family protein [Streptomyces]MCL7365978.1 carboxylesterase family protein [Streptomyces ardesiacus]
MTDRNPVVRTAQGAVRGSLHDDHAVFLGVPYAAPPVGAARFAAPRPHDPWEGVLNATEGGPTAPQAPRRLGALEMTAYFGSGWVRGPDYLTVNVWTPRNQSGDTVRTGVPFGDEPGALEPLVQFDGARVPTRPGAPVMVFVHGGGFVAGSNRASLYDGSRFARDGVVLVTVNYRLGIPGFLDLPGAPRNRGLLDVLQALRWVRENVAAFGGDPGNVTLFGQSAGATIAGAVLADPAARGLLSRVIVQSGNGRGAFTPEQAARVTARAAAELGVAPHAEAFARITDDRLVEITPGLSGIDLRTATAGDPLLGLSPFSLVLDRQPADAVAAGQGAHADLLIGTNAEEGHLYLAPFGTLGTSTAADLEATAALFHPDPARYVASLRRGRPGATAGELRSALMAEALFVAGSRDLADAHAAHPGSRTFRYEFAWRSPALGGHLGAAHAVEVPFVFDVTDQPGLRGPDALLGAGTPPAGLAARTHAAWIAFATTGDPGWAPYERGAGPLMRIAEQWETAPARPAAPSPSTA